MTIVIHERLKQVPDYRTGNAIRHVLSDILMIGLLTILCNGNEYSAMRILGEEHEEELKKFLELPNGIPSQDTFEDVFAKINPKALSTILQECISDIKESALQKCRMLVSVDGKTIRGSKGSGKKATHIVTAFASELRLVLGEIATDEKSNEITAIPKLLEMFCQKGMIITIDAMGTQTAIAETIITQKADYVLSVKKNQGTLHNDVSVALEAIEYNATPADKAEMQKAGLYALTEEKGHGRIESRECYISTNLALLSTAPDWKGLVGFGMIVSRREVPGKIPTINREYFIYSVKHTTASEMLHIKRSHWAIENNLHWTLDVVFREDESRARLNRAPENLNILRKQALQLLKEDNSFKASAKQKRFRCSLNFLFALDVIGVR